MRGTVFLNCEIISPKLEFQIIDHLVNVFHRRFSLFARHSAAFRFFNLEIDARVVLGTNHSKQGSDGTGSSALSANDLTHILRIDLESQKNSHFINLPVSLNLVWLIN